MDNEAPRSDLGLGLHLGSVLEQVSDDICLAGPGRHVEGRLTPLGTHTHKSHFWTFFKYFFAF